MVEKPDAIELPSPLGEVKFNNVKFSYQGKEPAIGGISFTIPPGTKTAIGNANHFLNSIYFR